MQGGGVHSKQGLEVCEHNKVYTYPRPQICEEKLKALVRAGEPARGARGATLWPRPHHAKAIVDNDSEETYGNLL